MTAVAIAGCGDSGVAPRTATPLATCSFPGSAPRTFPASAVRSAPGAEREHTKPSAALRRYLRTPNARELGISRPGWIKLSEQSDQAQFALKMRPFGVVWQVTVAEQRGRWKMVDSTHCAPMRVQRDRVAVKLKRPLGGFGDPAGRTLRLGTDWDLEGCDPTTPKLTALETEERIVVSASIPWDYEHESPPEADEDENCSGKAEFRTFSMPLLRPLGDRAVLQGDYVPARTIPDLGRSRAAPIG